MGRLSLLLLSTPYTAWLVPVGAVIGKIARAVPWWAWLALVVGVAFYVYGERKESAGDKAGAARVQAGWDAAVARGKAAIAEQNRLNAAKQATAAAEVKAIGDEHARANRAALAEKDRTITDLRSGALRLRKQWAGCLSAAGARQASGGAGGSDDAAELRETAPTDLAGAVAQSIYLADTADAQVIALQGIVKAQQKLCQHKER